MKSPLTCTESVCTCRTSTFNSITSSSETSEPLLFHTGMRGMFPAVREAVATLIDPAEPSLDQLEPLRGRRMRRAQRVAGGRPERHARVRRNGRDDQHRRLLEPAAARAEAGRGARDWTAPVPLSFQRRICRMGGTRACCSKKPNGCCCART